jgi:hypothetical protein
MWISVKDQLPTDDMNVIVRIDDSDVMVAYYDGVSWWSINAHDDEARANWVKHWMSIPKLQEPRQEDKHGVQQEK